MTFNLLVFEAKFLVLNKKIVKERKNWGKIIDGGNYKEIRETCT